MACSLTQELENNLLTGEIPSWLFNINGLEDLFLEGNNLIWNNNAKIVPTCMLLQLSMKSCGLKAKNPILDFYAQDS